MNSAPAVARVVAWLCVVPFLTLAFIYGTWVTAAASLGRTPVVYADDPYGINALTRGMQTVSVLLLVAGIPLMVLHVGLAVWTAWRSAVRVPRDRRRLAWSALSIVVWACFWILVRRDPGLVLFWLMD